MSVIVVDIIDDGAVEQHRRHASRVAILTLVISALTIAALCGVAALFVNNSWYVGADGETVGIYQGIKAEVFGHPLSHIVETTSIKLSDLPETTQKSLAEGVAVASEQEARNTVKSYREQIDAQKVAAAETADKTTSTTNTSPENPATPKGSTAPAQGQQEQQPAAPAEEPEGEQAQGGEA